MNGVTGVWTASGACTCADGRVKAMLRKVTAKTDGVTVECPCGEIWQFSVLMDHRDVR